MNEKVNLAVDRLNTILPLKVNQVSMSDELQDLHRDILYSYVDIGRSLNRPEISRRVKSIEDVIRTLEEKALVVFSGKGEPMGAYPFTMEKRKHEVSVNAHRVHCMCALDSLAVSPMYKMPTVINSVCHLSGDEIVIRQDVFEITNADEVDDVFFGINWNAADAEKCCASSLCTEMVFIRGESMANKWCNDDLVYREIFTLPDAVDFSAAFFVPLVQ